MGRVYLSIVSVLLLLLLAWHYSIQVSAHNIARDQVRIWLNSMGASAEHVDFRMLRGALTINNIKAQYQGGEIRIQKVFIKGNPASIATNNPMLQQVDVQQFSFDAAGINSTWKNIHFNVPQSLNRIFFHAKNISFQQGEIKNVAALPSLIINHIHINGKTTARLAEGQGYLGDSEDTWQLQSLIPQQIKKQQGSIVSLYQGINTRINWTGTPTQHNVDMQVQQKQIGTTAKLTIHLQQEPEQWSLNFNSKIWELNLPQIETTLTGQGRFLGTPQAWIFDSKQLLLEDNYLTQSEVFVEHAVAEDILLHSSEKNIAVERLLLNNAILNIDTQQEINLTTPWQINIDNISMDGLETIVYIQGNPISLPLLHGSAKLSDSSFQFDLSGQNSDKQFVRLKSTHHNIIHISADQVPLRHLRNLLPAPIQQEALTLEGQASLKLWVKPLEQWSTSGDVHINAMVIASKNQLFKADSLSLRNLKANQYGVQQGSLSANNWLMQFPLTPRQAWSKGSYLDAWAQIPWSLENIHFAHGQVAIGSEQQVWLQNADLNIQHWQSDKPTLLTLQGEFGHTPLQANLTLEANPAQTMQWQSVDMSFQDAEMFALSDWLQLSGFPRISQGHLSLFIHASQHENQPYGSANVELNQLTFFSQPLKHDYLLEETKQNAQSVLQQLVADHEVAYTLTLKGEKGQSLSELTAQTLLHETTKKLSNSQHSAVNNNRKHKTLGSIRIHQGKSLSHNERSRLRKMIRHAKTRGWHIELSPDLGTAELTAALQTQIYHTQTIIKSFIRQRGIKPQNIYLIAAQDKHHSTSSTGAIHINLVK